MPKDLKDFPRPVGDNGRGLVGSASTGWSGGKEGYDFWISELEAMRVKWFKVLDDHGDSLMLCTKLLEAGILPIVRIIRKDPPPNDSPEPNPGHINSTEEEVIRRLIGVGVRYFETNNEPNLATEWKNEAMPGDNIETAKLVALNWLFDARFILAAGGYPGLPAISAGGNMDLMGALVALGRQDILLEGCWIALHNYCQNRPLDFPDDPVNRIGQPITPEQYDQNVYTNWAWWRTSLKRADSAEEVNSLRTAGKSPTPTIQQDHACFREFEYYNALAMKYLGRSIPIISTEGGYLIGHRVDARYPAITPDSHRDLTVALFDYMQRQAPDYYFAAMPSQLVESEDMENAAWYSSFWKRALAKGSNGAGTSTVPVPGASLGDRLPVIDAVKGMLNLPRRMPGMQPAPPVQAPASTQTHKATPLKYVVMQGDTLPKIAKQFGTTWKEISALNQLATQEYIHPGQTLLIPRPPDAAPTVTSMPPDETVTSPSARAGLSVLFPDSDAETTTGQPSAPKSTQPPAPVRPTEPSEPITPPTPPKFETPKPAAPPPPAPLPASEPVSPAVPPPPPPVYEPPKPSAWVEIPAPAAPPSPPSFDAPTPTPPPSPVSEAPMPATPAPAEPSPTPQPGLAPPPKYPDLNAAPIELEWDWRLDALGVVVHPANVAPGQEYWRLVRAVYQSPDEAGGNHHIYYTVLDENQQAVPNQHVWQGWSDDKTDASTDEKGETSIPLWASYAPDRGEYGPYFARVDDLPSDGVVGMGLPLKRHVNFLLTWQRTMK